jgi:malate synthase
VAHPDLVPFATAEFDAVLGERPNQLGRLREDVAVGAAELLDFRVPGGEITDEGLRTNVSVGARYLDAWLRGVGAVAIDNLMEDAATAEISRAQVWSWIRAGRFSRERVGEELARVDAAEDAKQLFAEVALAPEFLEFLTVPAYRRLP